MLDGLEIRPVPAGHAPGASGFLVRFREEFGPAEATGTNPIAEEQHVLVTGDFTTRPCAGFPPLPTTFPVDVGAVLLNVATDERILERRNEAIRTVLERAYGGSRVVVAASALTGVQYSLLLAAAAAELDRELPITVVGQTARIVDTLGIEHPTIESRAVFDRPRTVLEPGTVTIAGPDEPRTGSAKRLLLEIHEEPADAFVQLTTGGAETVSNATCSTYSFRTVNHPTPAEIDAFVRHVAPTQLVIKHASGYTLNKFQRRYDRCFTWGSDDEERHVLYEAGDWTAPGWISEPAARRIRQRQWNANGETPVGAGTEFGPLERQPVSLQVEGVDVAALRSSLSGSVTDPYTDRDSAGTQRDGRADTPGSPEPDGNETLEARVFGDGDGKTLLEVLEPTDLDPGDRVEITVSRPGSGSGSGSGSGTTDESHTDRD